ncbi:hypothetical protein STEG23_034346, partial [Scotinomys teguina]
IAIGITANKAGEKTGTGIKDKIAENIITVKVKDQMAEAEHVFEEAREKEALTSLQTSGASDNESSPSKEDDEEIKLEREIEAIRQKLKRSSLKERPAACNPDYYSGEVCSSVLLEGPKGGVTFPVMYVKTHCLLTFAYMGVPKELKTDNIVARLEFLTTPTVALNAWNRIQEIEKKIEPFAKVMQGPKETFTDFLQRLISAVNRMPNSEARQIKIESLDFENANIQCKKLFDLHENFPPRGLFLVLFTAEEIVNRKIHASLFGPSIASLGLWIVDIKIDKYVCFIGPFDLKNHCLNFYSKKDYDYSITKHPLLPFCETELLTCKIDWLHQSTFGSQIAWVVVNGNIGAIVTPYQPNNGSIWYNRHFPQYLAPGLFLLIRPSNNLGYYNDADKLPKRLFCGNPKCRVSWNYLLLLNPDCALMKMF